MLKRYGLMLLTLLLLVPGVQAKSHKRSKHRKHHPHKVAKNVTQEERDLRTIVKRIDNDSRNLSNESHVELLTNQFDVPLSVVEDLRNQGQGWGNISVMLAMSHSLTIKDAVHYPDAAYALSQVQSTRAVAKSWSDVAHRMGIEMHWVILATAHCHKNAIAQVRAIPTLALASN